jgi:UDP-N-acetyl-D-mannosaminuronic acid transferase (WecB/TagA/CpsF family)
MVLVNFIFAELVLNAVHQGVPACFNYICGNADRAPDILVVLRVQ